MALSLRRLCSGCPVNIGHIRCQTCGLSYCTVDCQKEHICEVFIDPNIFAHKEAVLQLVFHKLCSKFANFNPSPANLLYLWISGQKVKTKIFILDENSSHPTIDASFSGKPLFFKALFPEIIIDGFYFIDKVHSTVLIIKTTMDKQILDRIFKDIGPWFEQKTKLG